MIKNEKHLKIISLGLGVQSTAMYMMSSLGYIPRADHAIFADPGAELPMTYEILEVLRDWASLNNGIPIHVNEERRNGPEVRPIVSSLEGTFHRRLAIF